MSIRTIDLANELYSTRPLTPTHNDLHLFVGRKRDLDSFTIDCTNSDKALVVVTGHKGVGKTSFVNVLEYAMFAEQVILQSDHKFPNSIAPCIQKIQIEEEENIHNLLFKCLSSIVFSFKAAQESKNKTLPAELHALNNWLSSVVPTVSQSGGISFGGLGANVGSAVAFRSIKDIPLATLREEIARTVQSAKNQGYKGIFLNLNNLEIVSETLVVSLMNQLRDYLFDLSGLWIVLIGYPGMYSTLANLAPRVSEYISGQETQLEPLSLQDVLSVIERRKNAIQQRLEISVLTNPISDEFLSEIYENSNGEIRSILKACSDIVRFALKENPNLQQVPMEAGKQILRRIMQTQLGLENLKPKELDILAKLSTVKSLRPKDFESIGLKSAVDFTNRTKPLLEKGLVRKQIKGSATSYELTGQVILALYTGIVLE
jgi:energy-coupling factor transporter ATP-binding protein EcfA2